MKHQEIVPKHQVPDNEISAAYMKKVWETHMTFHFVPSDDHQHNLAEKAIQTWKYHFIGIMSGTAAMLPVHLWYQAIPQADQQLLNLRQPHVHPKVSAYAQVYGPHNYNVAPFVTIGIETLMHGKPKQRDTFAEYCIKDYILGKDFEHSRACKMWMKDTRAAKSPQQFYTSTSTLPTQA